MLPSLEHTSLSKKRWTDRSLAGRASEEDDADDILSVDIDVVGRQLFF